MNKTGKGGFRDHPENVSKSGQRNKAAVQFSRTLRELIVTHGEKTIVDKNGNKRKRIDVLIDKVWDEATNGKEWAVQFIAERTEGKITQPFGQDPDMPFGNMSITLFTHDDSANGTA